jgi:hypothetical protein
VQSLQRELKKLKMCRDGTHCRALLTLLARRGIFHCTNASYHFHVANAANGWNQTECEARRWEPVPGALIPKPFQAQFPHVVDCRGRALRPRLLSPLSELYMPETNCGVASHAMEAAKSDAAVRREEEIWINQIEM